MGDEDLTGEHEMHSDISAEEFERELKRVGVKWEDAQPEVFDAAPTIETPISDDEVEVGIMLNVSVLADALRSLPDGAGTAAFLEAFRARRAEFEAMPPDMDLPPGFSAS